MQGYTLALVDAMSRRQAETPLSRPEHSINHERSQVRVSHLTYVAIEANLDCQCPPSPQSPHRTSGTNYTRPSRPRGVTIDLEARFSRDQRPRAIPVVNRDGPQHFLPHIFVASQPFMRTLRSTLNSPSIAGHEGLN
jgi:hypothetical protein